MHHQSSLVAPGAWHRVEGRKDQSRSIEIHMIIAGLELPIADGSVSHSLFRSLPLVSNPGYGMWFGVSYWVKCRPIPRAVVYTYNIKEKQPIARGNFCSLPTQEPFSASSLALRHLCGL